MSGGGSGNTQTVQQSVPPYLQNQHQQNLTDANNVTGMEYQPYTGPRIAGWTDDQTNAFNMLRGQAGSWQAPLQQAVSAASGIASGRSSVSPSFNAQSYLSANPDVAEWARASAQTTGKTLEQLANEHWNTFGMAENRQGAMQTAQAPQIDRGAIRDVTAGKFTDADLSAYENPYTQSVIDTTLNTLSRQNDILQNQANAKAAAAGAFGGSRQAVMNAENNRNYLDQAATTTAQLNNQKFAQAQAAIANDQNRALQAGIANQGMDYNTAAQNAGYQWNANALNAQQNLQAQLGNQSAQLSAAQLLNSLGGSQQQYSRNDANALLGIGGTQQAYNQSNLDLAYNDFLNQRNYLSQQLAARNNYLNPGMSMGGTSSTTMPGASWLQTGIGSLAGLGGAYSMLTGNPIFGAGGLLGSLGSSGAGTITSPIIDSTASGLSSMIG